VGSIEWAADAERSSVQDVGVDHGGGDVAVAEEFLDGADVVAGLALVRPSWREQITIGASRQQAWKKPARPADGCPAVRRSRKPLPSLPSERLNELGCFLPETEANLAPEAAWRSCGGGCGTWPVW
jgi:hypothetical protein